MICYLDNKYNRIVEENNDEKILELTNAVIEYPALFQSNDQQIGSGELPKDPEEDYYESEFISEMKEAYNTHLDYE